MGNINIITPKNFNTRNWVGWAKFIIILLILPFLAIPLISFVEGGIMILLMAYPILPVTVGTICLFIIQFLKMTKKVWLSYLVSLLNLTIASIILVGFFITSGRKLTLFEYSPLILMVLLYILSSVFFSLAAFSFRYHIITALSTAIFLLISAIEFLNFLSAILFLALPISLLLTYLCIMDHFWIIEARDIYHSQASKYSEIFYFIRPAKRSVHLINTKTV